MAEAQNDDANKIEEGLMFQDAELNKCQVAEKKWMCPVKSCKQILSRRQTLKGHLTSIHQIKHEIPEKKYKKYEYNISCPVPRSSFYSNRKMLKCPRADDFDEGSYQTSCSTEVSFSHLEDLVQIDDCESDVSGSQQTIDSDMEVSSDSESDDLGELTSESEDERPHIQDLSHSPLLSSNKNIDAPLYVIEQENKIYASEISQYEHLLSIVAYSTRHNLSDTAINDLVKLIGLHLPPNNLMETDLNKMKERCGFGMESVNYFTFCNSCKSVLEKGVEKCTTPNCNTTTLKNATQSFFMTGSLESQLKEVLTRGGIWESIQETFTSHNAQNITDIVDGQEYKKLKEAGQFLSSKNNITLTMFTDGVALFKSSGVTLWPVYLLVNEIPRKDRFSKKNMIVWGIWQGIGKPNMTLFLKPLVKDLQALYQHGLCIQVSGEDTVCKVMLIVATMDLPARSSVLQMTQHNGKSSCLYCMDTGKTVKSGKGHCRSFPYNEIRTFRTTDEIRANSQDAQKNKGKVNGFLGDSVLNYLPNFSLNINVVIDYMHGLLLGISKKFLTLWFDSKHSKNKYFIGDNIKQVDKMLQNITPPCHLKRLPRKLSNTMHHWKASELRSWLLFYSLPCLQGVLPDIYLKHFSLIVEATYILLGEGISECDLKRASLLFETFVRNVDQLYDPSVLGLNVHNLLHLTDCVRRWGPVWAWSCFAFESFNGDIKKSVHGTGNVCRQIFWSIQAQKRIENIAIQPLEKVNNFIKCMNVGNSSEKSGIVAYQCFVNTKTVELTETFVFPSEIKKGLLLMTKSSNPTDFLSTGKIVRSSCQIYSKICSRVKKRNSYTVIVNGGTDHTYALEIEYFLLHKSSLHVFAVGRKLALNGGIDGLNANHIQRAVYSEDSLCLERVTTFTEPAISFKVNGQRFISKFPNMVERD